MLVWGLFGMASVASMWWAWSVPGAIGLFACIGLAFLMWNRLGSRGSWMALVVIGLGMASVLGWQAATGSRCPDGDSKVILKENRPPVGCDDIRASAATMAVFFGIVGLIGMGAPLYARRMEQEADDAPALEDQPTPSGG